MRQSNTKDDFERIIEQDHINLILNEIKKNVPDYFSKITTENDLSLPNGKSGSLFWIMLINDEIEKFDKDSLAYRDFFSEEMMEEFDEVDDPKFFKNELRSKCPIIRKTMMSKMEELQTWKEDFVFSKPQELLDTFVNILEYFRHYIESNTETSYNQKNKIEDFSELSILSNDENYYLKKVLGIGINTSVIYNIDPRYAAKSVRKTLYGLYFLTNNLERKTPSRTNEFVMIDDISKFKGVRDSSSNYRMEHNFWYPYHLFMLYSKTIYDSIEKLFADISISLDPKYRYVYVNIFLEQIVNLNKDAVQTMMGGDQDY